MGFFIIALAAPAPGPPAPVVLTGQSAASSFLTPDAICCERSIYFAGLVDLFGRS